MGFPLSPTLSPLIPRGARECKRKVHSRLNSTAVPPVGEREPEGRVRGILRGSWSQCAVAEPWVPPMNLKVGPRLRRALESLGRDEYQGSTESRPTGDN